MTKEEWLVIHGSGVGAVGESHLDYDWIDEKVERPCCLVDNGAFTSLGVAYNRKQFEYMNRPDGRVKAWYIVSLDDIKEECPNYGDYIKDEK